MYYVYRYIDCILIEDMMRYFLRPNQFLWMKMEGENHRGHSNRSKQDYVVKTASKQYSYVRKRNVFSPGLI